MKYPVFIYVFIIGMTPLFAQLNFQKIMDEYPLYNSVDCKKNEAIVLEAAVYLLSHPINTPDNNRYYAYNYIETWMIQTSDYFFDTPSEINEIIGLNFGLKAIYKASLCKTTLTHENIDTKSKHFRIQVLINLLNYIEKPKNQVTITKKIEKYLNANKSNSLKLLIH